MGAKRDLGVQGDFVAKLLVIHGPNLNLLGTRETARYGTLSLDALNEKLVAQAKPHQVECFQSNAEHELVNKIQTSPQNQIDFIIINAAAFTHTSIALRDALLAVQIPFFEVHITNIFARETFRHHSYLSDIAVGLVCGLGVNGYFAAVDTALNQLS